ncbi:transcription initiation factor IID TAF10 subunit [Hygrophoropsis aurantiaca]|uniref:Transcription initiation factor IID TAF10 subunit n=1 Tax=Hygrophoropsis aurantiaca TaxID=72124 RepID=A0ACB8ANK6_9AGAM|nr:transcription initiation factor IID TAF10 subunit [Hygrophoropsis aurantiaca]
MSTPGYSDPQAQTPQYGYYPPQAYGDASQQTQGTSQTAAGSSSTGTTAPTTGQQSRQAAEEARKDRTLAEFLVMLDEYEPLIPNEVTDYYLQRVGFECEDTRLKRLLSLAAQKFVSDIAADAYQHARIRTNATGSRARGPTTGPGSSKDKTRTTLTMDDLSAALAEYGINSRKPEFYL